MTARAAPFYARGLLSRNRNMYIYIGFLLFLGKFWFTFSAFLQDCYYNFFFFTLVDDNKIS